MLNVLVNRQLNRFAKRYDYDVDYLRAIAAADPMAFLRFSSIAAVSTYRRGIPPEPYFAAKLRAIVFDDCGPCTQLVVNMALEAGIDSDVIAALVRRDYAALTTTTVLVARFTDLAMAHSPDANDLREDIRTAWGERGLVSVAFAISSSRVYPALKYALGFGQACTRVAVGARSIAPSREEAA